MDIDLSRIETLRETGIGLARRYSICSGVSPQCATTSSKSIFQPTDHGPSVRRTTSPHCCNYRIQYRLNIRRRAGDDAQNFARRSLLLQRFLEFLEQPHVLDGDHRLVGEGFEQLDLRRGEGAHLGATCVQCSNEFPLLSKGNDQKGARWPPKASVGKSSRVHGHREDGACHARASSDTVIHQH